MVVVLVDIDLFVLFCLIVGTGVAVVCSVIDVLGPFHFSLLGTSLRVTQTFGCLSLFFFGLANKILQGKKVRAVEFKEN